MNRIERLTAIVLLLQDKPHTSEAIAQHFEVSKRTVLRDVQALSEMGVPIIAREGTGGGYSLPADYSLAPLPLGANEAFLLLLALGAIKALNDLPFIEARATLLAKLHALLPAQHHQETQDLLEAAAIAIPERSQRAPYLGALLEAIRAQHWLEIRYRSAERESTQVIFPRRVFADAGLWYCEAYAHAHEEYRRYRVDRVYALRVVTERRDRPPEPVRYDDPSHPLIEATLTARGVALTESDPDLARLVQRTADGGGLLQMRCPPSELAWYTRYFAGLGEDIRVHAPEALREGLRNLGLKLVQRYQNR